MAQSATAFVTLTLLALTLLTFALRYLFNVVLANNLPPETYGDLMLALRFLGIAASVALLGTASSSKRFLAKYIQLNKHSQVASFMRWNTRIVSHTFLASVVIAVLASVTMLYLHFSKIRDINEYHFIIYMIWITPLAGIGTLAGSYLLCSDRPIASYVIPYSLRYFLLIVVFAMLFFLAEEQPSNVSIAGIIGSAWIVVVVLELAFIYFKVPELLAHFRWRTVVQDGESEKQWLRVSQRLIVNSLIFLILSSLDLIIIEIAASSEAEVGYYAAVMSIVGLLWLLPGNTLAPFSTAVSSLIDSAQGKAELQRLINGATRVNAIAGGLIAALIIVFADLLLGHFGEAYLVARPTLVIACLTALLGMVTSTAPTVLAYSNEEQALLRITLTEFAALIVLGLPLAYVWGMFGVAVATLLCVALRAGMTIYRVRTIHGLRPIGLV